MIMKFVFFSMTAFHQENISRFSNVSDTLVELLNNGKPLSLYIDGIVSVLKANGKSQLLFVALLSNRMAKY